MERIIPDRDRLHTRIVLVSEGPNQGRAYIRSVDIQDSHIDLSDNGGRTTIALVSLVPPHDDRKRPMHEEVPLLPSCIGERRDLRKCIHTVVHSYVGGERSARTVVEVGSFVKTIIGSRLKSKYCCGREVDEGQCKKYSEDGGKHWRAANVSSEEFGLKVH